jgi:hypothetical protein
MSCLLCQQTNLNQPECQEDADARDRLAGPTKILGEHRGRSFEQTIECASDNAGHRYLEQAKSERTVLHGT